MKKNKFLYLILSVTLVLCFCLTGCGGADTSKLLDETLPWVSGLKTSTETLEYSFSRYLTDVAVDEATKTEDDDEKKGYKLNSSGTLTYTLTEGASIVLEDGTPKVISEPATADCTLIAMTLHVEYKSDFSHLPDGTDDVQRIHKNKTDTMTSYAVINRYYLNPLFTYKKTVIGAQESTDYKSYTLTADYTGDFTGKKQAKLIDSRGEFTATIKDGSYYDSESLYYIVRSMQAVRTSGTTSREFDITSPYDALLSKQQNVSSLGASASTATTLSKIGVSESVYDLFDIPENAKNEEFNLECFHTTLSLTETKSGPPIELYYSSYSTKENPDLRVLYPAKKILVQSAYVNHDKDTNAVYLQEFTLDSYSNNNLLK